MPISGFFTRNALIGTPEIRFGVFGESGSGKTVLLSTFFGQQQEPSWLRDRGYSLFPEEGNYTALLEYYNQMRKVREFPSGTRTSHEYMFSFKLPNYPPPFYAGWFRNSSGGPVKICWYDYPGEWWTDYLKTEEDKTKQKSILRRLLNSHVGFSCLTESWLRKIRRVTLNDS